nr:immunoglobulin heavy chain junction region [Macaca mulatta]
CARDRGVAIRARGFRLDVW